MHSPTPLQEKLADAVILNVQREEPLDLFDLLVSVGYSESTASGKPGGILAQKGVIKALAERGFTQENAKAVVSKILIDDKVNPGDRLRAAAEIFKVTGAYAPERSISININADPEQLESLKAMASKLGKEIKDGDNTTSDREAS